MLYDTSCRLSTFNVDLQTPLNYCTPMKKAIDKKTNVEQTTCTGITLRTSNFCFGGEIFFEIYF